MDVLGKTVSERTETEIVRILRYLPRPVIFQPLQEDNSHGFGCADFTASPNWIVYSVTYLPQESFEANVLHELYHLCQITEGFPTTSTKQQLQLDEHDQNFLNRLGRTISSVILDLDVCDRISGFGLSSEYFFNARYKRLMSYELTEKITRRDSKVSMSIILAGIVLQNQRWQANEVFRRFQSTNPQVVQRAKKLASRIKKCEYNTPEGCFRCLATVYDYLDIWDWQQIHYQGLTFDSSEEVDKFLSRYHQDS